MRIYPGCSKLAPVSRERRADIRRLLGIPDGLPVIIFVGALGYDSRKGFDTLWTAWQQLCAHDDWKARLVVAGDGRALEDWRRKVRDAGLANRVLMLGFTDRIAELLAIADLMVSSVRYEPYGMSVHEAISFGIPAIVSAAAGIAELYPSALRDMLLVNPEDPDVLTKRLLDWNASRNSMKNRFDWFAKTLKARTVEQMACELIDSVNSHPRSRNCAI
jgi:glycosyltransferase involved in cell wall biosynthesis